MNSEPPSLATLARVFGRIGLISFGGPAAQIALMHRELVERRRWLDERSYLKALSFCMLLPGPEAMQLATYAGWRLRGTPGGLIAGGLFVLPGAAVVLVLAAAYAAWGALPLTRALFLGIKATVVVVVIEALVRLGRRALPDGAARITAALSFVAIFALSLPFPLLIALAALWGALRSRAVAPAMLPPPPRRGGTARVLALWLVLWLAPLAALWLADAGIATQIGLFFARLAVLSFGGAYAALAWMAQTVVADLHWLSPAQMLDGLGLAETTPGPLILVTEFVGYLAGHRAGGALTGLAGALVTLWMIFAPCFLFIFAGAPHVERLTARPRPAAALAAITAAVVGVILNLSLWFAAHVFFARVGTARLGPVELLAPDPASLRPEAVALAGLAALLLWRKWPLPAVLALTAAGGALLAPS
ncbi:chromate efflux transporter [Acidimangrovimonas pyrenivorans]|uniref:Chromate efflux transporter n=1 Tax=Acidimangrovimonas pyrenivorans TaxID=2030798 RepID=A0ABV7AI56_9RHOB